MSILLHMRELHYSLDQKFHIRQVCPLSYVCVYVCERSHLRVSQPLRQPHYKHQVPLDHSDAGQVFPVLCDLLLLLVLLLLLLVLYPLQLLL